MASEAAIVRSIMGWLNSLPNTRAVKIHGSQYQSAEVDILGSVAGRALALEAKLPGKQATPRQVELLAQWADAGAIVGVVYSLDDAKALVTHGD